MAIKIGHASISENGTIRGSAGDQNGKEVFTRSWYRHSKGWVTLRCKVPAMREYIARAMERACANPDIGYDQIENQTLWNNVKPYGFDPARTTKKVETDCARLVRVCCQYACEMVGNGKTIPDFYTATLKDVLRKTGLFEVLTADQYNRQDDYLLRGDIQVTKTKGHTWVILENGSEAEVVETEFVEPEKEFELGQRILRNGMEGEDVKQMQAYLNQLGYDCGAAYGEFGDATEIGVREFQEAKSLEVDGEYGPKSHAALMEALEDKVVQHPNKVKIVNGNCYVRSAPNTTGKQIGVARKGEEYRYGGETSADGWNLIEYKNQNGWVSGKYSVLEG